MSILSPYRSKNTKKATFIQTNVQATFHWILTLQDVTSFFITSDVNETD